MVGAWVLFTAMLIAAPSLWLAYNAKQFGDPLDFIRGPYSARAIEARTTPPGSPPRPGIHNLHDAALYFLKAAELGAAPLSLGKLLCWLSAAGTLAALWAFRRRQIWPVLLLWLPLPFYALLRRLRIRAHLHSRLAPVLLVQHPLRHGAVARLRPLCGLPHSRC